MTVAVVMMMIMTKTAEKRAKERGKPNAAGWSTSRLDSKRNGLLSGEMEKRTDNGSDKRKRQEEQLVQYHLCFRMRKRRQGSLKQRQDRYESVMGTTAQCRTASK
ncbi:unnamed protein product [Gongylonema pulchrum]|uniref:Secreted protein n=1 Tax=Gongylonema pulchrum TaxID=637853 RepID=A0A183DNZ8_9BILA|nr:unnamed protein product [Gongylonema pulchrum]